MSKLNQRLMVKMIAGAIVSLPIDFSKTALEGNDFIQDPYIESLKPGVVVGMSSDGYIKPAGTQDIVPLGFLVNDAAGYANQNVNARANGLIAVLTGNGNQFVTDGVVESNVTPGAKLFANDEGLLTTTQVTYGSGDTAVNASPVAISLSANSATNKEILVQSLI